MSSSPEPLGISARELADMSALADGTLDPTRRDEVQSRISASTELSALYARERLVVERLDEARSRDRAPAALRARIEQQRPRARVRARRRIAYAGMLAASLAAVVLALVLILPSGTPGSPSLSEAAGLAIRGPAAPAPVADASAPSVRLDKEIDEIYFPNWEPQFGWRAVGQRTDQIAGREAVTVYYEWQGRRLSYTIVATPPLTVPAAHTTWVRGTELHTLMLGGRLVVTWRRNGNTCILSATGVTAPELQRLAAWKAPEAD
jgi:anti-sigma factor RsiW